MYPQVTTCGRTNKFHNVFNETSTYRFEKKNYSNNNSGSNYRENINNSLHTYIYIYIYMRQNAVSINIEKEGASGYGKTTNLW